MTIEIVIARATVIRWENSLNVANHVFTTLREHKAPVGVSCFPTRIEAGCLVFENDPFDDLQVTWREDLLYTPVAVEVVVTRAEIERFGNPIYVGNHVMQTLRKKGAPVEGALFPTGVERGSLVFESDAFDDLVVTWRE